MLRGVTKFEPPRRVGLVFQGGLAILLGAFGLWNLWQMAEAALGPDFVRYLLLAMLALVPFPLLVYRFRALQRGYYGLERDGIRLRWGFRVVDIPIDRVLWVHPREDLLTSLPLPWLRWPGAILGVALRPLPGAGRVEVMASTLRGLVLIGTAERVFAVSPANPGHFLNTYHRLIELGSLSPIPAVSERPLFLLGQLWQRRPVRALFLAALLLNLGLFLWVILVIPTLPGVALGAPGSTQNEDLLPAAALLLFPFLNVTFLAANWVVGLFFYRTEERRYLAYMLWGSSVITATLFLTTLLVILIQA
jgi:hypothetical protein